MRGADAPEIRQDHRAVRPCLRAPPLPYDCGDGPPDCPPGDTRLTPARGCVRRGRDRLRRPLHVPCPVGCVRGGVRDQPDAGGCPVDDVPGGDGHREPAPGPGLRRVGGPGPPDGVDGPAGGRLARGLPRPGDLAPHPRLRGVHGAGPPALVHRDVHRDCPPVRGGVRARPGDRLCGSGDRGGDRPPGRSRPDRHRRLALDIPRLPCHVPRRRGVRLAHDERPGHRRADAQDGQAAHDGPLRRDGCRTTGRPHRRRPIALGPAARRWRSGSP